MTGKVRLYSFYFSFILLTGVVKIAYNSPIYSYPALPDPSKYSMNKQVVVAPLDRPLDEVLEAVMQLDGNVLLLLPQRELNLKNSEKRDPPGPDLGTGRSYTGQRTAKVMWGQLASNSPTGPGKRKRNSTDGEGAAPSSDSPDEEYFHTVVKRDGEMFPQ